MPPTWSKYEAEDKDFLEALKHHCMLWCVVCREMALHLLSNLAFYKEKERVYPAQFRLSTSAAADECFSEKFYLLCPRSGDLGVTSDKIL